MFTIRRSFGRWRIWLWSNRRESWRVTKVRENLSILVRNRWVFWRQTWDNNQPCLWGQEPDIIYVKTENLQVCLWQFKPKKKRYFLNPNQLFFVSKPNQRISTVLSWDKTEILNQKWAVFYCAFSMCTNWCLLFPLMLHSYSLHHHPIRLWCLWTDPLKPEIRWGSTVYRNSKHNLIKVEEDLSALFL